MKKSLLIKELEKYNPDSEVKVYNENWEGELKNIESVDPGLNPQYCIHILIDD